LPRDGVASQTSSPAKLSRLIGAYCIITFPNQNSTMTSKKWTQLSIMDELTSLAADSHASPTASQGSDWARKTNATCGRKCCASFEKLPRPTLWAKTFAALLIGRKEWSSRRCALTWKLKGTTFNRSYFLLQASALPTGEIASGLLLTPTTSEQVQDLDKFKARMEKYPNGTTMPNLATQVMGLLPTPTTKNVTGGAVQVNENGKRQNKGGTEFSAQLHDLAKSGMLPTPKAQESQRRLTNGENRSLTTGQKFGIGLEQMAKAGMLPTPNAMDYNTARSQEAWEQAKEKHGSALQDTLRQRAGQGSQLNPRFVAEMMGFPVNWTESPFQSGEKKA
jgi:hypothetical protein